MTTNLPLTPSLPNQFRSFLTGQKKLSASSIKNYVSDINLFCEWLQNSLQEDQLTPAQITASTISAYRDYLNNSRQTINAKNRHLSSLRRFGLFLFTTKLADQNPAAHLANVDPAGTTTTEKQILKRFKAELNKQQLSPSTIKNYLSDARQYLNWAMQPTATAEKDSKITDNI